MRVLGEAKQLYQHHNDFTRLLFQLQAVLAAEGSVF